MTLKGGSSQACAACKYQRRKCTQGCLLAPYFPADKPHMFRNVHRLFGVSNLIKILKNLDPSQQPEAMTSIITQARLRDMYPVQGSCHYINTLMVQIHQAQEELNLVYSHLEMCRQQFPQPQPQPPQVTSITDTMSQLELGMALPHGDINLNALEAYGAGAFSATNDDAQQLESYSSVESCTGYTNGSCNTNYMGSNSKDSTVGNPVWLQNQYDANSNRNCDVVPHNQLMGSSERPGLQQEIDYDDLHPFFDAIDDRQSYVESKVPCESSSESSLKDSMQSFTEHVSENELKSAAACFSLLA